jgi:hypothetical protein
MFSNTEYYQLIKTFDLYFKNPLLSLLVIKKKDFLNYFIKLKFLISNAFLEMK